MPPIGRSACRRDPGVKGLITTVPTVARVSSAQRAAPVSVGEKRWTAGARQPAAAMARARSSKVRTEWGTPTVRTLHLRFGALDALAVHSGHEVRPSAVTVQW
jgi:hypothetical protein